jgi:hypothetical protein
MPHFIESLLAKLKRETRKDLWLDWVSWSDGFGSQGVMVEQNLPDHLYSPFISPESARITLWQPDIPARTMVVSAEELENLKGKLDLLLDHTQNKIYVRGQQLTSREIPSASATIDILSVLMRSPRRDVANKDLPTSCYRNSRYDLQSKITTPLSRSASKILGKNLEFGIHGGSYDNFHLNIKTNHLSVGLVEKISHPGQK